MQSGYGEMHRQYIVDHNCPPSLFSSSTPSDHQLPNNATSSSQEIHHKFRHSLPHPTHPTHPTPHFVQFGHPVPITQQLFHHPQLTHHHQQFQLYHHQQHQHQMGLDHESEPDNSNSPGAAGPASFLAAMNFKLGLSESSGGGTSRDDDGILQSGGGGGDDSGSRHHSHLLSWNADVDSNQSHNLKQPFWRPLDIDYINTSNKRPSNDKQQIDINPNPNPKHFKKNNEVLIDQEGNYKLFSELEAIYKPGGTPNTNDSVNADGGVLINCNNQTGSGSALTGDEHPLLPVSAPEEPAMEDTISDTSNNEEVLPQKPHTENIRTQKASSSSTIRRARTKRRQQKELASISSFFESLVKQLMDQEETFHRKFLELMEKKDEERSIREDAWRRQETARSEKEAAARAQERQLAAARESAIVTFLERITGESLKLPAKNVCLEKQIVEYENSSFGVHHNSGRWPKAEVEALIRVRSGYENRFQEPGLKGQLWEEVSLAMGGLGYQRSAKRCKEKWENINKYFRKTKESGKKRPRHSKTCPYFQQLDQLYSTKSNDNMNVERKDNSELLDAIVVANDGGSRRNVEFEGDNNEVTNNEDDGGEGEGEGEGESREEEDDYENLNKRRHGDAVLA